jgi:hypothetical protein
LLLAQLLLASSIQIESYGCTVCRDDRLAVAEDFEPVPVRQVDGIRCDLPDDDVTGAAKCRYSPGAEYKNLKDPQKIALFHYITKSWQDFEVKMVRGDGNSPLAQHKKTAPYFLGIQECVISAR